MNTQSSERISALQRAIERWKRQLLDVSGRNRLLNYRDLTTGTLDLTPGEDSALQLPVLENLLAGRAIQSQRLFPDVTSEAGARRRLVTIHRQAQGNVDEKGLATLFAGVGLATWSVETGGRPNAPVILIPISVAPADAARWNFKIEASGDPRLNPVLVHVLRTEHGVEISDQEVGLPESMPNTFAGLVDLLGDLQDRWSAVRGLEITPRMVLGNFNYANMAMVEDLENSLETFAGHDLIAAIAGVEEARRALEAKIRDPSPGQPDIDPPRSEFLVLDADASQHLAINRALGGESLVIWGPPGTGKSQTIANLIAAKVAQGQRVLLVAEKRAAIDVVVYRLGRAGLSELVMDIHGGVQSKREFAQGLAESIRNIKTIPERDYSALHERLAELRGELIVHDEAMHQHREPWGVSLYEVQEKLMGSPEAVQSVSRMDPSQAREVNRTAMDQLMRVIQEWVDLGGPSLESQYPDWARAKVASSAEALEALNLVRELSGGSLAEARTRVLDALGEVGIQPPESVGDCSELLGWLAQVERLIARYGVDIYALDHASLADALAPATRWWAPIAPLISSRYRAAMKAVAPKGEVSGREALTAVHTSAEQLRRWRKLAVDGGHPRVPTGLAEIVERVVAIEAQLKRVEAIFGTSGLLEAPYTELASLLDRLISQEAVVANLSHIRELQQRLSDAGFDRVVSEVGRTVPLAEAGHAVERAWLLAVWDDIVFSEPHLSGFSEALHSRRQQDFIDLDRQHLGNAPERVKRAAAEAAVKTMSVYPTEADLVNREAAKRSRHLPIRQLFQQAPHVLTAVRPCWAMSPLLVAELIPAQADLFDVVIFDEASQIPPADAIGVLARAPQAVIAGDDRQLPPTAFFDRQAVDEEENSADEGDLALTHDIESILDVAKACPIREQLLQWHYRSRDGRLIAFSNANIYHGALTTFPGTAVEGPLTHDVVPFRPLMQRSNNSNPDEVGKVVDMIIDHARRHQNDTLGVITFGIRHADNIDDALRRRLREMGDPTLDRFFSGEAQEPFFVKSIERVQGDERDAIILSTGYHKADNGTLPYRFGPLNQAGGERRLNVAVSRSRNEINVVSSFSHHDMEPGRSNAVGVELLRQYLEFAASGGSELPGAVSHEPLNGFELDVMNRLTSRGIPVTPQYAVSGYQIDFACAHPDRPGQMVLAIEADGASYHSGHTARERDRLRQQVLEDKGWRFHRIWSTAWFRNPEAELQRAVEAWEQACRYYDAADDGVSSAPEPEKTPEQQEPSGPIEPIRAPRPNIRPGLGIVNYSQPQLVALARWILSDTLLRTDDDLKLEMRKELGFSRNGVRIEAALTQALTTVRSSETRVKQA